MGVALSSAAVSPPPARGGLRVVTASDELYSHPTAATVCEASPRLCHRIGRPFSRQSMLKWYGVVPQSARLSPAFSSENREPTNCTTHAERPECRAEPEFCAPHRAAEAPPLLLDTVPCKLGAECASLEALEWYHRALPSSAPPRKRLERCLRGRNIVFLGDSVLNELWHTLVLSLSRPWAMEVPSFAFELLSMAYKFGRWEPPIDESGRLVRGPLSISFSPNQRNATFHDATLNTTITILHSGGLNLSDHGGTRTVLDPKFAPELLRLGVHPSAQSDGRRADVLFAGTTFHDDTSLGETCSTTGCACNRSWAELEAAHKHDKRRYARYLTAVQRRGTQVVYMSMFPRCKDHCGAPDFLRAFADDVAHHELHAAGFYEAGGRFVDQWPLAAAYWDVKQRGKSQYGPSSLHYATTSIGDRYVLPDFVGMREQFALNALCSDAPAAHQPCGPPGRNHFTPQARTVYDSGANCSCGPWGLSIHRPILCNTNADPSEVEWGKWNVTERGRLPRSPNLLEAGGVRLA